MFVDEDDDSSLTHQTVQKQADTVDGCFRVETVPSWDNAKSRTSFATE